MNSQDLGDFWTFGPERVYLLLATALERSLANEVDQMRETSDSSE